MKNIKKKIVKKFNHFFILSQKVFKFIKFYRYFFLFSVLPFISPFTFKIHWKNIFFLISFLFSFPPLRTTSTCIRYQLRGNIYYTELLLKFLTWRVVERVWEFELCTSIPIEPGTEPELEVKGGSFTVSCVLPAHFLNN